jgi:ParB family transcriptional regulator, chromosome partitioning protein
MDAVKKALDPKQPLRKLGRGLSSLMALDTPVRVEVPVSSVPAASVASPKSGTLSDFQSIGLTAIVPSRFQPRKVMDDEAIARLADSIKRSGLMQPVVVRPTGSGYELIAGERRWRAAKLAGLAAIPALVREVGDEQAAEWGLIENVQREDLNAMERAWALRDLASKFGLQHTELADRVGLDRSTVANLIRLTELESEITDLIAKGKLSAGHGKALLMVPAGPRRIGLAIEAAESNDVSVRELEMKARLTAAEVAKEQGAPARQMSQADTARVAGLRDLERQISEHLGTKAFITTNRTGKKGRLVIEFYGIDHFQGVLARMGVRS